MDGDRGDLTELVKKHNTDHFPPPFTNKFVGAENNNIEENGDLQRLDIRLVTVAGVSY